MTPPRKLLPFLIAGLLVAGSTAVAAALADSSADPASPAGDDRPAAAGEAAESIGGTIERYHDAGECDLVGGLTGNWTHGSYVSGVAALGDTSLIPDAAKSDCGKPLHAVNKTKGGRPAHAMGKAEAAPGLGTANANAAVPLPAGS